MKTFEIKTKGKTITLNERSEERVKKLYELIFDEPLSGEYSISEVKQSFNDCVSKFKLKNKSADIILEIIHN